MFNVALKLRLIDLNYNFECDWLIELSDNKLSNNNLASELVENRSFLIFMINNGNRTEWSPIWSVIKTITKFSNAIGYQQPDLSINWTVAHVMLVIVNHS